MCQNALPEASMVKHVPFFSLNLDARTLMSKRARGMRQGISLKLQMGSPETSMTSAFSSTRERRSSAAWCGWCRVGGEGGGMRLYEPGLELRGDVGRGKKGKRGTQQRLSHVVGLALGHNEEAHRLDELVVGVGLVRIVLRMVGVVVEREGGNERSVGGDAAALLFFFLFLLRFLLRFCCFSCSWCYCS